MTQNKPKETTQHTTILVKSFLNYDELLLCVYKDICVSMSICIDMCVRKSDLVFLSLPAIQRGCSENIPGDAKGFYAVPGFEPESRPQLFGR